MPLLPLRSVLLAMALCSLGTVNAQEEQHAHSRATRVSGVGGLLCAVGAADDLQRASGTIGIRGGLVFGQRFLLGVQFSATSATLSPGLSTNGTGDGSLQVNENGLWAQYAVTRSRTVQPFVGLQLGWGKATWTRSNADAYGGTRPGGDAQVMKGMTVITPSIGVHFNCCTWFRPDLVLGYRMVDGIEPGSFSSTVMNGPFIGTHVMFGGYRR